MNRWEATSARTAQLPILAIDFDGTIHSYRSGWQGSMAIPDPPVPGAIEWLCDHRQHFQQVIVSSRFGARDDELQQVAAWLVEQGVPRRWLWWPDVGHQPSDQLDPMSIRFARYRPPALLTIDDRALRFTGSWAGLSEYAIKQFKPWHME